MTIFDKLDMIIDNLENGYGEDMADWLKTDINALKKLSFQGNKMIVKIKRLQEIIEEMEDDGPFYFPGEKAPTWYAEHIHNLKLLRNTLNIYNNKEENN